MPTVAAVVGAGDHLAEARQLLLEDDPLAGAAADDARDANAASRERLRDRVDDRRSDTTAHEDSVARLDQLRLVSQRTGHIRDRVAGLEVAQVEGALANGLDDQRDRAGIGIPVGDRQGDPFRARPCADDHELACVTHLRDAWRVEDELRHVR